MNVVVDDGQSVAVVSVLSSGKEATVVLIPGDFEAQNVAFGYGRYRFSKLYAVGQIDGRGGETLRRTSEKYLGVALGGFFKTTRKFNFDNPKAFFTDPGFVFQDRSNLNIVDRVIFAKTFGGVRFDRLDRVDLGQFGEALVLSDGSTTQFVEEAKIDSLLSGLFVEPEVAAENGRITVQNSTEMTGMGGEAARILTSTGLSVVEVTTAGPAVGRCQLAFQDKWRGSFTVRRVREIFKCEEVKYNFNERSDIVVIVGTDFADGQKSQ
ncbi:MAG: hypothetical protein UY21_C0009G0064 [Microgenomates group bacterium GW2011_GWA1_48_10]|nr:MAG: hypothetical protein UY21_C0009G0064 [Microgenomates group bacterium GW2011_GWA1_48_10]